MVNHLEGVEYLSPDFAFTAGPLGGLNAYQYTHRFGEPMINFAKGQINLDEKNFLSVSDYEELRSLAANCLIEKREYSGGIYYYVESIAQDKKFCIFTSLREKRIDYIALRWLGGPCTSKGLDDVSEKTLKEEYRLLCAFVAKILGRPPDDKRNRQRTWRYAWGQVEVSYEPRDFVAQIYMKPR